jgi:hypothetical protein
VPQTTDCERLSVRIHGKAAPLPPKTVSWFLYSATPETASQIEVSKSRNEGVDRNAARTKKSNSDFGYASEKADRRGHGVQHVWNCINSESDACPYKDTNKSTESIEAASQS